MSCVNAAQWLSRAEDWSVCEAHTLGTVPRVCSQCCSSVRHATTPSRPSTLACHLHSHRCTAVLACNAVQPASRFDSHASPSGTWLDGHAALQGLKARPGLDSKGAAEWVQHKQSVQPRPQKGRQCTLPYALEGLYQ